MGHCECHVVINESLELEIIAVLEALNRLKESPDYQLSQRSDRKPGVLDELAAQWAKLLDQESVELEKRAAQLAEEIARSPGRAPSRII